MRKRLIRTTIATICLFLLLSACASPTQGPLANTGPIQESKATTASHSLSPTSPPKTIEPEAAPTPAFTPVAVFPHKNVECSPLALDRSLILKVWDPGAAGQALTPYDPELGAPLCNFKPISAGKDTNTAISPDGSLLAFSMTNHEDYRDGLLHFIDLKTWKDIATSIEVKSWIASMAFSPDSRHLAIAFGMPVDNNSAWPKDFSVIVVDVNTRAILSKTTIKLTPSKVGFTPDGAALMVYGTINKNGSGIDSEAHALLLDAGILKLVWDQKLDGVIDGQTQLDSTDNIPSYIWWQPALVLSIQNQKLFIVHADGDQLTSVDFGKRTVVTVAIHPKASLFERLLEITARVAHAKAVNGTTKQAVLSPDGTRLYVVGISTNTYQDSNNNMQMKNTYLGLQVIDTTTGIEITHLDSQATDLALSSDGKTLYLHGWKDNSAWTDILDAATLRVGKRFIGRNIQSVSRLDQEVVVLSLTDPTGAQTTLAIYDPNTLEQKNVWWMWGSVGLATP